MRKGASFNNTTKNPFLLQGLKEEKRNFPLFDIRASYIHKTAGKSAFLLDEACFFG